MAKRRLSSAAPGPYGGVPTPEQLASAITGVDTAWNESPNGPPPGWYPSGETGWSQTPPPPAARSYDQGAGAGGTVVVAPPYDPATDPAYQQLLAQLGLKSTTLQTAAARRIGDIQTEGTIAVPRIQEQGIESRRGIDFSAENRGMFRSGGRLRNLAIQRRGEEQRIGDTARSVARQVAGVNTTLEGQLQDIATQKADAAFQARLRAGT